MLWAVGNVYAVTANTSAASELEGTGTRESVMDGLVHMLRVILLHASRDERPYVPPPRAVNMNDLDVAKAVEAHRLAWVTSGGLGRGLCGFVQTAVWCLSNIVRPGGLSLSSVKRLSETWAMLMSIPRVEIRGDLFYLLDRASRIADDLRCNSKRGVYLGEASDVFFKSLWPSKNLFVSQVPHFFVTHFVANCHCTLKSLKIATPFLRCKRRW